MSLSGVSAWAMHACVLGQEPEFGDGLSESVCVLPQLMVLEAGPASY